MGSFTIYCAGCAGPFTRPSLGSTSQKALARRRRMQRKLETGYSDAEDDEEGDEDGNEVGHEGNEDEEDEEYDEFDEDNSYDPEIFTEDNFNWLEYLVCLGFHKQAFLSGEGYYTEQGEICATQGNDTNCPEGENAFWCYADAGEWPAVFPFHPQCFDILTLVLTGSTDVDALDKDILYRVLTEISGSSELNLDYGPISGNAQFWESIPGEEFSVCDPIDIPNLKEFLRDEFSSNSFKISRSKFDIRQKVVKDSLGALPYDILCLICSHLPGPSVISLTTASWPVFAATRHNNGFWKQRIQQDMPWFSEVREVIAECDYPGMDFKGLYLWLDKMTTPRCGLEDVLLAIANRRRIWGVCEKISDLYFSSRY